MAAPLILLGFGQKFYEILDSIELIVNKFSETATCERFFLFGEQAEAPCGEMKGNPQASRVGRSCRIVRVRVAFEGARLLVFDSFSVWVSTSDGNVDKNRRRARRRFKGNFSPTVGQRYW